MIATLETIAANSPEGTSTEIAEIHAAPNIGAACKKTAVLANRLFPTTMLETSCPIRGVKNNQINCIGLSIFVLRLLERRPDVNRRNTFAVSSTDVYLDGHVRLCIADGQQVHYIDATDTSNDPRTSITEELHDDSLLTTGVRAALRLPADKVYVTHSETSGYAAHPVKSVDETLSTTDTTRGYLVRGEDILPTLESFADFARIPLPYSDSRETKSRRKQVYREWGRVLPRVPARVGEEQ